MLSKLIVRRLWLAGVLLLLPALAQAGERRVALVLGNSDYKNAPVLSNPVKDARAVADMLKAAGFQSVELKLNLESLDLKRAVRSFLLAAKDSDIALIYFAGHGLEVNGANYVIPTDAKLKTDFDAEDEGVALDRMIRAVEPARRLRLVILDACRDNPFINLMQRTVGLRALTSGLAKIEPEASDTLVAYAARAGSVAEDGSAEHSPFTTALLKHLPTPGLDIRVAFGRVRDDVIRSTNGKQEPFVYGSLGGSTISLVPEPEKPVSSKLDPAAEMRHDYEFAERVGTRDAWEYFLQAHPTGFLPDLARAQLMKFPPKAAATDKNPADAAKAEARRPASPSPVLTTVPTLKPAVTAPPSMTAAVAPPKAPDFTSSKPTPSIMEQSPCERDREKLARLRQDPNGDAIAQFSRDLSCAELRPQLARLIESVGIADPVAPAVQPSAPAPQATVATRSKPPVTAPAPPPPVASTSAAPSCDRERAELERLRATPDFKAVDRLARTLTCAPLKPQVMRLRESLDE